MKTMCDIWNSVLTSLTQNFTSVKIVVLYLSKDLRMLVEENMRFNKRFRDPVLSRSKSPMMKVYATSYCRLYYTVFTLKSMVVKMNLGGNLCTYFSKKLQSSSCLYLLMRVAVDTCHAFHNFVVPQCITHEPVVVIDIVGVVAAAQSHPRQGTTTEAETSVFSVVIVFTPYP